MFVVSYLNTFIYVSNRTRFETSYKRRLVHETTTILSIREKSTVVIVTALHWGSIKADCERP